MDDEKKRSGTARLRREQLEEKKQQLEKLRASKESKQREAAAKRNARGGGAPTRSSAPQNDKQDIDSVVKNLLGDRAAMEADKTPALSEEEIAERERRQRAAKMAALASQHNVVNINIPSKDVPTYEKGVQASIATGTTPRDNTTIQVTDASTTQQNGQTETKEEEKEEEEEDFVIPEVSDAEKEAMVNTTNFSSFFNKASRVMERALILGEKGGVDFTVDYTADESKDIGADKVAQEHCAFYDETLCKNRAVTDIAWSPKHQELIVVAYSDRLQGTTDDGQEGMVIVWNMMTPAVPEMVFYCQSPVLRAFVSQFNPNLIIGSTYSGQVVVWDKSQLTGERVMGVPTHRTPLSPNGHTLPVYSMDLVGSDNANSLVTVSTDGKMRSWTVQQLEKPQDKSLDLFYPVPQKDGGFDKPGEDKKKVRDPLAVTCTSFVDGDGSCIMGGEDGKVFAVNRHARVSDEAIDVSFSGHDGPVTSVSASPHSEPVDFSGLFVSTSMDWTIRLWDRKHGARALHIFEDASDYVYDAKWSPTHPAVFGSVDGTGNLSIWNLNTDLDIPIGSIRVCEDRALNRVAWGKDGRKIAVGTSHGYCHIFDAKKEIAVPRKEDWGQLSQVVDDLKAKAESAQ